MRLAYISYEFLGHCTWGGVATSSFMDAKSFARHDLSAVFFIAGSDYDIVDFSSNVTLVIVPCSSIDEFRNVVVKYVTECHEQDKFDVIESCDGAGQGYFVARAFSSIPFITRCHTPLRIIHHYNIDRSKFNYVLSEGKLLALKCLRRLMIRRYDFDYEFKQLSVSDVISCPSKLMCTTLKMFYPITSNLVVVPYGVDEEDGTDPVVTASNVRFGFIGTLDIRKGLPELISALECFAEHRDNFTFTFVGRQCLTDVQLLNFERLLSRWPTKILYRGQCDYVATRDFLKSIDVLMVPSRFDNYPLVCVEAGTSGCLISCSSMVGCGSTISKIDPNLLHAPFSSDRILRVLNYIADNVDRDSDWLVRMKSRIEAFFKAEHSLTNVANRHVVMLREVIHGE